MARYYDTKLSNDDFNFNLDNYIRIVLRSNKFKSVEVISTEDSFVIRHWSELPYDLDEHEKNI